MSYEAHEFLSRVNGKRDKVTEVGTFDDSVLDFLEAVEAYHPGTDIRSMVYCDIVRTENAGRLSDEQLMTYKDAMRACQEAFAEAPIDSFVDMVRHMYSKKHGIELRE